MKNKQSLSLRSKLGILIILGLLIFSGIAHGYNMFHYPYYENDEGTYMSQSWSLITKGKLAPYTYWYDHAPAGWVLIAIWNIITGGFFTFGASVNSGRVLMLVLHLFSTAFLYLITKKLSGKSVAGTIAVVFFSLSPLAIYFQRRVLLDNIMVFWVLLSLFLITNTKNKLSNIVFSAIAFGLAVLSKENAIFFIPTFLYVIYNSLNTHNRTLAIIKWLIITGLIISPYFLYALLKGEFFPVGFLGDFTPHVSLLTTLKEQASRGGGVPFWDFRSDFYVNSASWMVKDKVTIILGFIATVISAILSIRIKFLRVPTFLTLSFLAFLMRGKLVIDFYVVPLIPLFAMNIGMVTEIFIEKTTFKVKVAYYLMSLFVVIGSCYLLLNITTRQYINDETTPQINTIEWIKNNLSEDLSIIIDNSIYVDLHEKRYEGDKVFPNADWAWKVEKDPEILLKKLNNDWQNILYVVLSHEIIKQVKDYKFDFIKNAFDNSKLVIDWSGGNSYRDLPQYISTNGDWMSIYKVNDKDKIVSDAAWKFYKDNYIYSYGQVIDPINNVTTSEGQSYAMLRSVWLNDKTVFDGVWAWTQDRMQNRIQDKLFSWQLIKKGSVYEVGDSATASDADEDIALALLFAYKRWGDDKYLISAREIIDDIWNQEVVLINGRHYLISGNGGGRENGYLVNPSYLSPATYKIFAEVDTKNQWNKLLVDSYYLLNKLALKSSTGLPPNWILIERNTGNILSAEKYILDADVNNYGFDSFRTFWRVALDAKWNYSEESRLYLSKFKSFFEKEFQKNERIYSIYRTDGTKKVDYDSLSTTVGPLSVFTVTDEQLSTSVYNKYFKDSFDINNGYWGNKNNYFDQNWGWFGTALYSNKLPNLWKPILHQFSL